MFKAGSRDTRKAIKMKTHEQRSARLTGVKVTSSGVAV